MIQIKVIAIKLLTFIAILGAQVGFIWNSNIEYIFISSLLHITSRTVCSVFCQMKNQIVLFIFFSLGLLNFRKDARLPEQLQRAMAAEAEAAREARDKASQKKKKN